MCTELGVRGIQLARSERTQGAGREVRLDRLTRVAREATRQSGAPVVPRIEGPGPLLEVADRAPPGALRLLAWEGLADPPGSGQGAAEVPPSPPGPGTMDAWVVVGPEGGFSEGEVDALRRRGYRPIGLGSTILRVETAAPVALALVAERLREGRIGPG
jgi:16S rRNA (uracil1498-N3)-methyltransferase